MKVLAVKVRVLIYTPVWITCCFVTKLVFPVSVGNYAKGNRALRETTVTCTAVMQSLPVRKILWRMEAVELLRVVSWFSRILRELSLYCLSFLAFGLNYRIQGHFSLTAEYPDT